MAQFISYGSYNSILLVNEKGLIRQIYTPFKVYTRNEYGQKLVYIVEEVKSTMDDQLLFIIANKVYKHHHFIIDVQF
jgi:hypothetical protein